MLDFIVVSLPRSGSTWAANWLTDGASYCHHDPLWTMHYSDFDSHVPPLGGSRIAGIACTGIWMWLDWLNRHPARKLVLRRSQRQSDRSLSRIGLPPNPDNATALLDQVEGFHVPYTDLFTSRAEVIWTHLTGLPFDGARHAQLVQMKIEPQMHAVHRDMTINRRLTEELRQSCCTSRSGSSLESTTGPRSR